MALTRMISVAVLFSLFLSFSAVAVDNSETPKIAGLPADVQYPFMAKVTGNDVYVRSGKGTAYYACGKVNLDDQVTVVGEAFGWAEIIPPEGSYSWIHKNYVDVEDDQPTPIQKRQKIGASFGATAVIGARTRATSRALAKREGKATGRPLVPIAKAPGQAVPAGQEGSSAPAAGRASRRDAGQVQPPRMNRSRRSSSSKEPNHGSLNPQQGQAQKTRLSHLND